MQAAGTNINQGVITITPEELAQQARRDLLDNLQDYISSLFAALSAWSFKYVQLEDKGRKIDQDYQTLSQSLNENTAINEDGLRKQLTTLQEHIIDYAQTYYSPVPYERGIDVKRIIALIANPRLNQNDIVEEARLVLKGIHTSSNRRSHFKKVFENFVRRHTFDTSNTENPAFKNQDLRKDLIEDIQKYVNKMQGSLSIFRRSDALLAANVNTIKSKIAAAKILLSEETLSAEDFINFLKPLKESILSYAQAYYSPSSYEREFDIQRLINLISNPRLNRDDIKRGLELIVEGIPTSVFHGSRLKDILQERLQLIAQEERRTSESSIVSHPASTNSSEISVVSQTGSINSATVISGVSSESVSPESIPHVEPISSESAGSEAAAGTGLLNPPPAIVAAVSTPFLGDATAAQLGISKTIAMYISAYSVNLQFRLSILFDLQKIFKKIASRDVQGTLQRVVQTIDSILTMPYSADGEFFNTLKKFNTDPSNIRIILQEDLLYSGINTLINFIKNPACTLLETHNFIKDHILPLFESSTEVKQIFEKRLAILNKMIMDNADQHLQGLISLPPRPEELTTYPMR